MAYYWKIIKKEIIDPGIPDFLRERYELILRNKYTVDIKNDIPFTSMPLPEHRYSDNILYKIAGNTATLNFKVLVTQLVENNDSYVPVTVNYGALAGEPINSVPRFVTFVLDYLENTTISQTYTIEWWEADTVTLSGGTLIKRFDGLYTGVEANLDPDNPLVSNVSLSFICGAGVDDETLALDLQPR